MEPVIADSALAPIAKNLALREPTDATLEMLGNRATPNDEEKKAISTWLDGRKKCGQLWKSWTEQVHAPQEVVAVYERASNESDLRIADLYNGEITYGELSKWRIQRSMDVERDIAALQSEQDRMEAQNDQQRRIALGAALLSTMQRPIVQPQPIQVPAYQPIQTYQPPTTSTTNCQNLGYGNVNCTTTRY